MKELHYIRSGTKMEAAFIYPSSEQFLVIVENDLISSKG